MTTEHEPDSSHGRQGGGGAEGDRELRRRNETLLRLLEQAREQRGSPPLWDAVAARLDEEDRRRDAVEPMLRLLDQIRERVDDQTWRLILDFEWRSSHEVVAGVEVGLELGYDHGRAAALVEAQAVPGEAARGLRRSERRRRRPSPDRRERSGHHRGHPVRSCDRRAG